MHTRIHRVAALKWVLLCLATLNHGAATAQSLGPLVNRSEYFTGEQRVNFRLSPRADALYYQIAGGTDIHFITPQQPNTPKALGLSSLPKQWLPMDDGLLLLEKDSLWHLRLREPSGTLKDFDLPFAATKLRLLERPVPHGSKMGLWVEASAPEGSNGIWTLDLKSKALQRIDDLPPMESPILDGNFHPTAGTQPNDSGGNSIWARSRSSQDWKAIVAHPFTPDMLTGGFSKAFAVSADGNAVYYTSNLHSDKNELFVYHLDEGKGQKLLSHPKVDLLPFGHSLNTQGEVTSVVGLYAKTLRVCSDSATGQDFAFLQSQLRGDLSWGGQTPDGNHWLVREFTGGPGKYYLFKRSPRQLTYLCTDQPTMENLPLATRHAREVTAKDGTLLPIHVYLPIGSDPDGNGIPDKPLPTILYVHGGPWVGVFHWNQYFHWRNFQLLANRGYAVINCEFRGSTGLGKEFIEKSYKTWGTDMLLDNVAVADWAVQQGIAIEEKVGMWGWSYGGYAAMSSAALFPSKYACALAMYGISDLESFTKNLSSDSFWTIAVGDPSNPKEAKLLRQASAIHNLNRIKAPMLLTTGSKDDRIPQPQMGDMAQALKAKGKEVVYFYYPEEGHDYEHPASWISFWAIAEQFLAEHLGGRSQPVGSDIENGGLVVEVGEEYVKSLPRE